jgi:hypothetical protein
MECRSEPRSPSEPRNLGTSFEHRTGVEIIRPALRKIANVPLTQPVIVLPTRQPSAKNPMPRNRRVYAAKVEPTQASNVCQGVLGTSAGQERDQLNRDVKLSTEHIAMLGF